MELLELIETIRADEADARRLFGEDGEGAATRLRNSKNPTQLRKLATVATLLNEARQGKFRAKLALQEAMSTSDFPALLGQVLDRQMLASYREYPTSYFNWVNRATVNDFRETERTKGLLGGEDDLPLVEELSEYPEASVDESTPIRYRVQKFGRRFAMSWESVVNDRNGELKALPTKLANAARRTEAKFVTGLYVDANGPHAALYSAAKGNVVTGNPALSIAGLQAAFTALTAQRDENGNPIYIEAVELVIPPALEIIARNILNATELQVGEAGGTAGQNLRTVNWMKNRTRLNIDPYHPLLAKTANGDTSWYLFANPNSGRPALELAFLTGHEEPELFVKTPNARRVGGGDVDAMDGDFETDGIQYKVRKVHGGARIDEKMTVSSNGSGQ